MMKTRTTLFGTCLLVWIQISGGIAAAQDGPEAELAVEPMAQPNLEGIW